MDRSYSKFSAYALMEHKGDWKAASKAIRWRLEGGTA
jgi:hypothetical protein